MLTGDGERRRTLKIENSEDSFKTTMIWTDTETTGVEDSDILLEVGFVVTNEDLDIIDSISVLTKVSDTAHVEPLRANPFVLDMHSKSGLIEDLENKDNLSHTMEYYEDILYPFLEGHADKGTLPLAGSTVHFDRSQLRKNMPRIENFFHYRNIDVSSVGELCKIFNPDLIGKMEKPKKSHRVIDDIIDSIEQLRFYRDNFFFCSY